MIGSSENYPDRIGINLPGKPEEGESPSSQKLWYQPGRTPVSFFDAHFHPVILDHQGYLRLHLCTLHSNWIPESS
jgi:hypothetical protein